MMDYDVLEGSGGQVLLFVWEGDAIVWGADGFEDHAAGIWPELDALSQGDDPRQDWEGGFEDPQAVWDEWTSHEFGWSIVARGRDGECELFPGVMGRAAQIALRIQDEDAG